MIRSTALPSLVSLLALILGSNAQAAEPASLGQMACPTIADTNSYQRAGKIKTMPGSQSLATGIIWLDQGRYAAAYTALEEAISQGLPDQIERAHAYMQMGLIMCRLDSAEACQLNLKKAFMTNGPFELPTESRHLPSASNAYSSAQQYFEIRCGADAPQVEIRGDAQKTTGRESQQVSGADEAILLLNIQPWALVTVDGAVVLTPPTKKIMVKQGKRTISIKHPKFGTIEVEGDFKAGEIWVVQKVF